MCCQRKKKGEPKNFTPKLEIFIEMKIHEKSKEKDTIDILTRFSKSITNKY